MPLMPSPPERARAQEESLSIPARMLELISARICHDLISPVSAVGNGTELLTAFGVDPEGEVIDLIAEASQTASARLKLFRLAFGSALGPDGLPVDGATARAVALGALSQGRIVVDWPEDIPQDIPQDTAKDTARDTAGDMADGSTGFRRLGIKLVLNVVMTAVEALPGSGRVVLASDPDVAGALRVVASSPGLNPDEALRDRLLFRMPVESLTPATVLAAHAGLLAILMGASLDVETRPGQILIRIDPPASATAVF